MVDDDDILLLSTSSSFVVQCDVSDASASQKDDNIIQPYVAAYKVGEFLGSGGFGEVRIGTNRYSGQKVALKFVRKSDILTVDMANRVSMEIQSLMTLNHPNIRKLHTVSVS